MLKNIQIIIATIALSLALFSFFANFTILLPYVFILLSIMFILFGIDEMKKREKQKHLFIFSVLPLFYMLEYVIYFHKKKSMFALSTIKTALSQAVFLFIQTLSQVHLYLGLTRSSLSVVLLLSREASLDHIVFHLQLEFL